MNNQKKDLTVAKSNRLVESAYRMTLVEQRIILLAVTLARKTGKGLSPLDFVTITVQDYTECYGEDLNVYSRLKEAILTLYERGFTIYDKSPKGNREVITGRWVSAASYIDNEGTIRIRFSPEVVTYITHLEREFTKYRLEQIAELSSPYAIRLYELLSQWISTGKREVEISWLKKIFMIDDKYPAIKDFKKWVIDTAISQINEHSDLTIELPYEQRKTGRNVTHFTFTFAPKEAPLNTAHKRVEASQSHTAAINPHPSNPQLKAPVAAQDAPEKRLRDTELFQHLRNHGIGEKLALVWLRKDAAHVKAALEYTDDRFRKGLIKGSIAGYLRKLCESDNAIGPTQFEQIAVQKREEEKIRREKERIEREQQAVMAGLKQLSEISGTPLEKFLPKRK